MMQNDIKTSRNDDIITNDAETAPLSPYSFQFLWPSGFQALLYSSTVQSYLKNLKSYISRSFSVLGADRGRIMSPRVPIAIGDL